MKVKVITAHGDEFENKVADFINSMSNNKDFEFDIKFSTAMSSNNFIYYSAMIFYNEPEDKAVPTMEVKKR